MLILSNYPPSPMFTMSHDSVNTIKVYRAVAPLKKPITDATPSLDEISFLVLHSTPRSGITGEGYLLRFRYSHNAMIGAIKDISEPVRQFSIWETDSPTTGLSSTGRSILKKINTLLREDEIERAAPYFKRSLTNLFSVAMALSGSLFSSTEPKTE